MVANASMPSAEDRDRAYRARLKDEPLPGAVIDCATAQVLAANAGGLNALGLMPADRLPAALDSAMPAIVALRDLYRSGLTSPARKTLVFWRHGRTSTRLCDIQPIADTPSLHMPGHHVIVLFRSEDEAAEPQAVALPPTTTNAANDDTPPRIIRDDSETLKEIARRIREGQIPPTAAAAPTEPPRSAPVSAVEPPAQQTPPTGIAEHAPSPWDRSKTKAEPPPSAPLLTQLQSLAPEDIAKLAHELKTPLSAIAAASEIMRDERLGTMGNDKYLGYAADIHDSAAHALSVIAEMLNAAPSGAVQSKSQPAFDLTDLAAKTVSQLQPIAAQRSLTLLLEADDNLMPVRANATAIRQILLNLLTNALKFTPAGGEVRVVTGYLDDGAIFFVVRDTGDGMSQEVISDAFTEGPETLEARPGGGSGIGLRLVRRLAEENGCGFEIDSAEGQGTVVLVAFPSELVGER
jgi:two-component system, cell cycle sensor histidine kinase PleC